MKTIEVKCQSPGCNNIVTIFANTPYFGILCQEHSKVSVYPDTEDSVCESCDYKRKDCCEGGKQDRIRNDCASATKGVKHDK